MELGDGSTIVFLNSRGINGKPHNGIKNFLNYIKGEPAKGRFVKKIALKVDEVKRNDRLKVEYMSWYAEEMRIRRTERMQGKLEMIKKFLSVGAPLDLIIKATGWTKEKILEFAKKENINIAEDLT